MPSPVRRPLMLLAALTLLSLGARAALIGEPCRAPCRTATDHLLVFDEVYYVNAARRIAGVPVPSGQPYAGAPAGVDPNAEHPQLAKLIIAGSIELLGDGPWAWRLGSLVFGTLAILGMFALVRATGGGSWLALGSSALMALDNLLLVHGRIATLDVYVLAPMIWAAVLYLRGHILAAGSLIGLGACMKLVAPYALLALALFEGLRWLAGRRDARQAIVRIGGCVVSAGAVLIGLLALLDAAVAPYDQNRHARIASGPFAHIGHMLSFAAAQVDRHGARGIASYPWQWLGDYRPIVYLNIEPKHPSRAFAHVHPAAHFLGVISPPILVLALPALALAALRLRRGGDESDMLGLAWTIGTFAPFLFASAVLHRTSYLYYMVIVMPGIYLAVARLVQAGRRHRRIIALWAACVLIAAVLMYPFTPLPG